jgi:hypothetical protein
MGAGGSVSQKGASFNAIFADEELVDELKLLRVDQVLRSSFVDYLKGGTWIDRLAEYEEHKDEFVGQTVLGSFGYDLLMVEEAVKPLSNVPSAQTLATSSTQSAPTESVDTPVKVFEEDKWILWKEDDRIRSVLILAVLPMFMRSQQYRSSKFQLNITSGPSSPDSYPRTGSDASARDTRLRDLLHCAAAKFDASDIEDFLMQPTCDPLAIFQAAIERLPLALKVIQVGRLDEGRMVFDNSSKMSAKSDSTSGSSVRLITSRQSSTRMSFMGRASFVVPDVQSEEHRLIVQDAIDERRALKIAVPVGGGLCTLQALKPVYNSEGCCKYMLSVETVEPVAAMAGSNAQAVEALQRMEDALLLMPLLVKA